MDISLPMLAKAELGDQLLQPLRTAAFRSGQLRRRERIEFRGLALFEEDADVGHLVVLTVSLADPGPISVLMLTRC
jgi:hypothetical protein